ASYSGPFMVVSNSVIRSAAVQLARNNQVSRNLVINLTVFAEPKLVILGHDYTCRLTEAIDDRGNSLIPESVRQYNSMGPDSATRWNVQAKLAQPEGIGSKITRLKGSVRAAVQTHVDTWAVQNVSQAAGKITASKVIAGRRYSLKSIARKKDEPDVYEL